MEPVDEYNRTYLYDQVVEEVSGHFKEPSHPKVTAEFRGFSSPELVRPSQANSISPPVQRKKRVKRSQSHLKIQKPEQAYRSDQPSARSKRKELTESGEKTLTDRIDDVLLCQQLNQAWQREQTEHMDRFYLLRRCGKEAQGLVCQLNGQLGKHWQPPLMHRDKEHKSNLSHAHAKFVNKSHKDEEKETHSLCNAASDLWRTCEKTRILVEGNAGQFNIIQQPHELAYDDLTVAVPTEELRKRFLRLLRTFNESRDEGSVSIPESYEVDWHLPDHASRWVHENIEAIRADRVFSRFLKSGYQSRYTGLAGGLFLREVNLEKGRATRVKTDTRHPSFTRVFHNDGSHEETIRIPLYIHKRDDDALLFTVLWELHFTYTKQCKAKSIVSSGRVVKQDELMGLL